MAICCRWKCGEALQLSCHSDRSRSASDGAVEELLLRLSHTSQPGRARLRVVPIRPQENEPGFSPNVPHPSGEQSCPERSPSTTRATPIAAIPDVNLFARDVSRPQANSRRGKELLRRSKPGRTASFQQRSPGQRRLCQAPRRLRKKAPPHLHSSVPHLAGQNQPPREHH
jgi:hypothetical protein